MSDDLRRQIVRQFPELAAGYHLPVMAEVTAISDAPKTGGVSDNYRPRLAVDVQLLNSSYQETGIKLDAVPVGIVGGGDERGFFALPKKGTIVELAWLNGSPERPFVRSILGERQALPQMDAEDMVWQQSQAARQSVDKAGNWIRETDQKITDSCHTLDQVIQEVIRTIGTEASRVLGHSHEDIAGTKKVEAAAILLLAETVVNILTAGNINQVAGANITQSATAELRQAALKIIAKAGADITAEAGGSITHQAAVNFSAKAAKVHIGPDGNNLLKLISDTMAQVSTAMQQIALLTVTCTAPGSPSSVPANAAAFAAVKASVDSLKTTLDSITL
jgi:hypothetical protein